MNFSALNRLRPSIDHIRRFLSRPIMVASIPALSLFAFWYGGESALVFTAIAIPCLLIFALPNDSWRAAVRANVQTGPNQRKNVAKFLDMTLADRERNGRETIAIMLEIDQFKLLEERYERAAIDRILQVTGERLADCLRESDLASRLEGPNFAVVLGMVNRIDLDAALQVCKRLHTAIAEPVSVNASNVYVTASIGFCLPTRITRPNGENMLQAAMLAMIEAQRNGAGSVRGYSDAMKNRIKSRSVLAEDVSGAMERGEICAFFQPQVSTKTGAITGFEALARWQHPERGLIPPIEFLTALQQIGKMNRLGEIMVYESLKMLRHWDQHGLSVPRVGVNFSTEELRDPRLVERIAWELDRFDLAPDRLVVEVLETVVADRTEDIVLRNLADLARLGCCLDLDDFGTGHASITNIRRFAIERIKIDRSFVTNIDVDPEQQKMVAAILTMAEKLGLDTLAEGVETPDEQMMLASMGCGHIQGFGLGRPMPALETDGWIKDYHNQLRPRLIDQNLTQRAG